MAELLTSVSDTLPGAPRRHDSSGRCRRGWSLSRAERLEIISLVAAAGMGECSAWIIPMLERGTPDENPQVEKIKC